MTFDLSSLAFDATLYFIIVFFVVLSSALLQGSTIPVVANLLKLNGPAVPKRIHSLELVSMDRANAEMLEVELSASSPFAGQLLQTIGLPKKTVISAIIRDGDLVMPTGSTKLEPKDVLYILTEKDQVKNVKLVLAEENMK